MSEPKLKGGPCEIVSEQWAIYDHPRDFPGHYVVRLWVVIPNEPPACEVRCILFDTIEAARGSLPTGLHCIGRLGCSDAEIAEVWI